MLSIWVSHTKPQGRPHNGRIDYVLIHELAHLKHHDHGPDFWRLIDNHAEGWRKSKHHLDGLVEVLLQE